MSAKRYLLGIDVGSSGVRAACFTFDGMMVASGTARYVPISPEPGQVVYDADDLTSALLAAIRACVDEGIDTELIAGVSVAVPATLNLHAGDGTMPFGMLSVMDGRKDRYFARAAELLESAGLSVEHFNRVNRVPMIWMAQMLALKDLYPEQWASIDSAAISAHPIVMRSLGYDGWADTDDEITLTNLYDPKLRKYDLDLAAAVGLDPLLFVAFPTPGTPLGSVSADVAKRTGLAAGTPLFVGSSDSVAQNLALGCFDPDVYMVSLGTTALIVYETTDFIEVHGTRATVTTGGFDDWKVTTSSPSFGASYRWLLENICYGDAIGTDDKSIYETITARAERSAIGAHGLTFLPHFWGTYTNPFARSSLLGLNFTSTTDDIVRAVLEGTAFDLRNAVEDLDEAVGRRIPRMRVTGGGALSPLWLQIIADVSGRTLELTECSPLFTGCLGAAAIAGIGAEVYSDHREAATRLARVTRTIEPNPANTELYASSSATYLRAMSALSDHYLTSADAVATVAVATQ